MGTREEVRGSLDCTEFQQDGSTFHTVRTSLEWLSYHLREPLKSSSLIGAVSWPARYPDQTPCMSFYGEFEVANTYMDLCQRVCRILRTKSRWPFAAFRCRRWPREAPCARLEQNRGHIEHVLNITWQWINILLWPAKQNSTKRAFDRWHLRCIVSINAGVIAF